MMMAPTRRGEWPVALWFDLVHVRTNNESMAASLYGYNMCSRVILRVQKCDYWPAVDDSGDE